MLGGRQGGPRAIVYLELDVSPGLKRTGLGREIRESIGGGGSGTTMEILEQSIHTIFAQGRSCERGHVPEQLMARSGQIVVRGSWGTTSRRQASINLIKRSDKEASLYQR